METLYNAVVDFIIRTTYCVYDGLSIQVDMFSTESSRDFL